MRNYINILTVIVLLGAGIGCSGLRLEEGGAYQGDEVLYTADKTIVNSYKLLDSFVTWEHQNRAVLPAEVSRAADQVREKASTWTDSAIALREAYALNPNSENRSALERAVSILQAALAEAAKYMVEHEANRINSPPPQ